MIYKAVIAMWAVAVSIGLPALAQTQVMVGSALEVCSSITPSYCRETNSVDVAKTAPLYHIDKAGLARLEQLLSTQFKQYEQQTLKDIKALKDIEPSQRHSFLAAWYERNAQAQLLPVQLINAVLGTLEMVQTTTDGKPLNVAVDVAATESSATADIVSFIANATKVAATAQRQPAQILSITAGSHDPYAQAQFYEQLFLDQNIDSQWLALTPALASALVTGKCDELTKLQQQYGLYDRDRVYPEQTAQELILCKQGLQALSDRINQATAVVLAGDDQNSMYQVLFDSNHNPYPWTEALRQRAVIASVGQSSAVLSGGHNERGPVPMLSSGDAMAALLSGSAQAKDVSGYAAISYVPSGGLGSIDYGVIDSHFSESNRSLRLFKTVQQSAQQAGYGIDERTALISITSPQGNIATVLGESGVVKIVPLDASSFVYSYYPAGVRLEQSKGQWLLAQQTEAASVQGPSGQSLPNVRFGGILYDSKLRSLTQAMCMTASKSAKAEQYLHSDYWDFELMQLPDTRFVNTGVSNNACAIEGLQITFQRRQ